LTEVRLVLELARLMCFHVGRQVVRREKLKNDVLAADSDIFTSHTSPTRCVLEFTLAALVRKDTEMVFQAPVSLADYPNYLEFADAPMDMGTMGGKLHDGVYVSLSSTLLFCVHSQLCLLTSSSSFLNRLHLPASHWHLFLSSHATHQV
jgi:hypothetical protein